MMKVTSRLSATKRRVGFTTSHFCDGYGPVTVGLNFGVVATAASKAEVRIYIRRRTSGAGDRIRYAQAVVTGVYIDDEVAGTIAVPVVPVAVLHPELRGITANGEWLAVPVSRSGLL